MVSHMKLKDLMQTNLFNKCQLLTKSEGLNNTINSAVILETFNNENHFQKNQLVVTTFYELQTVSKEIMKQCFQK